MNAKSNRKHNQKLFWLVSMLMITAVVIAACQPVVAAQNPTAVPTQAAVPTMAPTEPPAPAAAEAEISVATDAKLGQILVGANGMTLYIFTNDKPGQSNCNDACLAKWPPLVTQGSPKLGDGVDASLVGTATLADGRKIVTYNQMPLYYFAKDAKAGDTTGQGVGSVWYVIAPDGKQVNKEEPAAPAAAPEAEINVATDAKLGQILVGANGMTLYIFTKDAPGQSNCNDACLAKWPALVTQGNPKLGDGVDASLVGTATLADGRKIVTYNQMPLYYFAQDTKAGDTNGQDVGSVWYVIAPNGQKVDLEEPAAPAAAASAPDISVATDAKLGQILVGANGMTLYIFTKDTPGQSNCNDACLAKWPPLVTEGSPKLGDGIDDSKIGTAALADGRKIVTYNNMPLYYFAQDTKAGDTNGQGVGSVWYTISPDGKPVSDSGGYDSGGYDSGGY